MDGRRVRTARAPRVRAGDFARCEACARRGPLCGIPDESRAGTCARLLANVESSCTLCRRKRGGCMWVCFRFEERSKK